MFQNSPLEFEKLQSFVVKKKKKKLNPGPKLPYLGWNLQKAIPIFEISILGFCKLKSFISNKKPSNLEPKLSYLGTFRLEFEKTIMIFEISTF